MVHGCVAIHHPSVQPATALGLTSGIGRPGVIRGPSTGAAPITAGLGAGANAAVFAAVALLGAGLAVSRTTGGAG